MREGAIAVLWARGVGGEKIRVYGWMLKVEPTGFMRGWMWGVRDETRMLLMFLV